MRSRYGWKRIPLSGGQAGVYIFFNSGGAIPKKHLGKAQEKE
jgi:hypothetical protein